MIRHGNLRELAPIDHRTPSFGECNSAGHRREPGTSQGTTVPYRAAARGEAGLAASTQHLATGRVDKLAMMLHIALAAEVADGNLPTQASIPIERVRFDVLLCRAGGRRWHRRLSRHDERCPTLGVLRPAISQASPICFDRVYAWSGGDGALGQRGVPSAHGGPGLRGCQV